MPTVISAIQHPDKLETFVNQAIQSLEHRQNKDIVEYDLLCEIKSIKTMPLEEVFLIEKDGKVVDFFICREENGILVADLSRHYGEYFFTAVNFLERIDNIVIRTDYNISLSPLPVSFVSVNHHIGELEIQDLTRDYSWFTNGNPNIVAEVFEKKYLDIPHTTPLIQQYSPAKMSKVVKQKYKVNDDSFLWMVTTVRGIQDFLVQPYPGFKTFRPVDINSEIDNNTNSPKCIYYVSYNGDKISGVVKTFFREAPFNTCSIQYAETICTYRKKGIFKEIARKIKQDCDKNGFEITFRKTHSLSPIISKVFSTLED